jgi:uncharacterized membrane protein YhhN
MRKMILYFFTTVGLGELISILFSVELLHLICKPLIMVTLCAYYLAGVKKESRSHSLVLAIVFCFAGDVLLMFVSQNASNFMFGLVAFLIAHVFYIMSYRQHKFEDGNHALEGVQRLRFAFPIVLAATGLIVILYPVLGALKYPVILYALVLMLMVINALFRYGYTNAKSFWMVFTGAVLFLISDSTLAINKFLEPVNNGVLIIMSTYILAQYLIIAGLIEHAHKNAKR